MHINFFNFIFTEELKKSNNRGDCATTITACVRRGRLSQISRRADEVR